MAWRIEEAVVRGEIDNRVRGRVTGRLWLLGRSEPVILDLEGNCGRDLAGRWLHFTNAQPQPVELAGFHELQQGVVGDITASRKVKVPDIPLDQIGDYLEAGKPFPWHWGNALYLEWFSEANARVVIESAMFALTIIGEAAWEMTPDEDEAQARANAEAMNNFMGRLSRAAAETPPEDEWRPRPQTEEEAEQQLRRSQRLADRIAARMAREGPGADYAKILEEEIARLEREEGIPEPTDEQRARNDEWIEEMNRAVDAVLADPDFAGGEEHGHPLAVRVSEFFHQVHALADREAWRPAEASEEHPVAELLDCLMIAGPKFAGALNGEPWPPGVDFCALVIVRLKRAREILEDAQRAAESCREEELVPATHLRVILTELADLMGAADELLAELRRKLERGTD